MRLSLDAALTLDSVDVISAKFGTLSGKFAHAKSNTKPISDLKLQALWDDEGDLLCPLITPSLLDIAKAKAGKHGGKQAQKADKKAQKSMGKQSDVVPIDSKA